MLCLIIIEEGTSRKILVSLCLVCLKFLRCNRSLSVGFVPVIDMSPYERIYSQVSDTAEGEQTASQAEQYPYLPR